MKTKTNKIMAVICLILLLLTSLPLQTFATFITDMNSNATFGIISGSLSKVNHELHYVTYDGTTYIAFCCQRGVTSPNGSEYVYNGDFIVQYKNSLPQYEKIAEMIYFGYTMQHGMGLPSTDAAYSAACATQQYVWEYISNNIDSSLSAPSRDSWNSRYMSSSIYANWLSQTESYYNQYHGNTSFNGNTNKITLGDSISVSDSNGRLSSYQSFTQTIDGITFSHTQGSNELNISASSDCTADTVTFNSKDFGLYQLLPNGSQYSSSTMSNYMYFKFNSGSIQNLIFSNYVDPSAFSISVEIEYGNTLIIKTNSVGNVLAGCTFDLYKDSNCTQKIRTGTSDSSGQIYFQRLVPGTYYVKESSVPAGYLLDTSIQKVEVKVNETAEISFKNYEPTGELELIKTDVETGRENRVDGTSHHGDATIEGTEYTLYAKNDIFNVAKTVKYFSKDEKLATFTFDSNGIAKINISTGSKTANLTTDGNILKGLPMGSYYAKETKVPEGYLTDNEIHNITLQYKDMHTRVIKAEDTFTNQVEKAKFEVIKVSSITNDTAPILPQAEFTAILTKYVNYYGSFDEALKHLDEFSKDEYTVFKTENTGHGISGLLAYGEYTVQETYCPSIWVNPVKPFKVVIDKNSPDVIKELVENDTPFESYLKMIKKDKKTGKTVTLSNTTFSLYKLNKENNNWERVSCKLGRESFNTWTTDENGIAYTETKLEAGTYKINEVKVPNGFLQLDEEIVFEVNRGNETCEYDKDLDAYITVTVENQQPTGTLIVDKSVAIREDVDTSLVDISDLSGIEFRLTAKEKIIDFADGSTIYEKGQQVKTFNLDKNGNYTLTELPMGTYELEEIKTLDGLVLNTTKYEVKFEQKDLTTKVYEEKKDITNDTTVFEFSKNDITGDKELNGATLTVTDKDGKVIDKWVSGEKTHKIEGLKVGETHNLEQDSDTLDTWFSSALWPFSTLGWPNTQSEDYKDFYPTQTLVTGFDIITFWISRMMTQGLEFTDKPPFKDVLVHGIVRDNQGRKMSKTLGNGIDPLEIIDKYGTDSLRFSLISGTTMGNDIRFMPEKLEQASNFANKVWNAAKFITMNMVKDEDVIEFCKKVYENNGKQYNESLLNIEDKWILNKLDKLVAEVSQNIDNYDLGIALDKIYSFIWDEFCDWYIEMVKPRLYSDNYEEKVAVCGILNHVFGTSLKLLHPFMPFVTSEIFSKLVQYNNKDLMVSKWPTLREKFVFDKEENIVENIKRIIVQIRNVRTKMNVHPSKKSKLIFVTLANKDAIKEAEGFILKLGLADEIIIQESKEKIPENAISIMEDNMQVFIPFEDLVDLQEEKERLEGEKKKLEAEVQRGEKMLSNPGFINKAPEAKINEEREKLSKYKDMLKNVIESLKKMK